MAKPDAKRLLNPSIQIAHDVIPGRTRFRIKRMQSSPAVAKAVEARVLEADGLRSIEINLANGSLLALYDPACLDSEELYKRIEAALVPFLRPPARPRTASGTALQRTRAAERPARSRTAAPSTGKAAKASVPAVRPSRSQSSIDNRPSIIVEEPPAETGPKWYTWPAEAVAEQFLTVPDRGLTVQEATRRAKRYGRNEVPDIPRRPRIALLREQIFSVPGLMLSAAAVFSLLTGGVADAIFIGGAILANAAIGYFTEDYAERTIQSLRQTRTPHARVLREGRRTKIDIDDVVPGDILLLEPGHVVAADGRIVRSENLVMDESLLTGESAGVSKTTQALKRADLPIADRANMVYAGSAVASGKGAAIVTATGLATELGRIRTLIGAAPDTPPPMTRELQRLGGLLAILSGGVCALFAVVGLLIGLPPLEVLVLAASLAVSAIPEGLPTVATTTLALGMKRMQEQNVVIRRLPAVSALGSSTILCVDKTGTLTENRMSVRCFVFGEEETEVSGTWTSDGMRFIRQGDTIVPQEDSLLLAALQVGVLCTEAELQRLPSGEWDAVGSATEQALLLTAVAAGVDAFHLRAELPRQELLERATGRNYMVSVHKSLGGSEVFVKGAPEEVLELCATQQTPGGTVPLTKQQCRQILAANARLALRGLRVLGIARGALQPGEVWHEGHSQLTWIGLVGMEDPVRSQAHEAIEQLRTAGIRTLMLTGDQRITAETVGRAVGLGENGDIRVSEAAEIERYLASGQRLPDVLARVSPEHKFEIVRVLQERGHVVMMTGDGINDAPALKAADVGIAMGVRSTQLARDLADVILLDDNLKSLPVAVGHGRTIFLNIRKALRFLIASNLSDVGLVGVTLFMGLPLPLTAIQLLWLNLVTDVFPAIALSLEPEESDVMQRPPRPPKEPLLTRPLWRIISREAAVIAAGTLGSYFWGLGRYGPGARARTLAFSTITLAEILYALACRSERSDPTRPPNRYLATCLGLSAAAQVGVMALPPLRRLLGMTPLAPVDWLVTLAASGSVLGLTEAMKRLPAPTEPKALPAPPLQSLPERANSWSGD
ncbi:MAG TPA: HAD-IC family P-type ATPase [Chthonomonadaceae bacterium]|nr:HAD-IC family P-type ATPase [Chthonomonadaceae bacterium]